MTRFQHILVLALITITATLVSIGILFSWEQVDSPPTVTIPGEIPEKVGNAEKPQTVTAGVETRIETVVVQAREKEKSFIEKFIEKRGLSHKPKKDKKDKKFQPDL